jgi:hypothetical protein
VNPFPAAGGGLVSLFCLAVPFVSCRVSWFNQAVFREGISAQTAVLNSQSWMADSQRKVGPKSESVIAQGLGQIAERLTFNVQVAGEKSSVLRYLCVLLF